MADTKPAKQSAPDDTLAKLEAMHDKIGALLHGTDVQDHAIRDIAIQHHDAASKQAGTIGKQLDKQYPRVDPELARRYGKALQRRADMQRVIHKGHTRHWDEGPEPAI